MLSAIASWFQQRRAVLKNCPCNDKARNLSRAGKGRKTTSGVVFKKTTPDVVFSGKDLVGIEPVPLRCQVGTGGVTFHVINRGVRRLTLFQHDGDYAAWLRAFAEAQARVPIDIFAYCLMPNHFHLVLRPREDGHLAEFMRLGTVTHSKRWHEARGSKGTGAVYQGRYRAFPIATDRYFLNACRYVEANPLRASMVSRAEEWTWSSLSIRRKNFNILTLAEWPILQPGGWVNLVNQSCSASELAALRLAVRRSAPFGPEKWARATADALGLQRAFREPGRPRKTTSGVVS